MDVPLDAEARTTAAERKTWQVELVPCPAYVATDPEARTAVALVTADDLLLEARFRSRPPAEPEEVAALLAEAVEGAVSRLASRPQRVESRHPEVVEALDPLLSPSRIAVTRAARLPGLDVLAASLSSGRRPAECSPEDRPVVSVQETWGAWGLGPDLVAELFGAAADYHRARPWLHLADSDVVHADTREGRSWAVSVMGNGGLQYGLAIYSDPADRTRLLLGRPGARGTLAGFEGRALGLTLDPGDELPRSLRREVSRAGWEVASRDAYPLLIAINTPGGGVSRRDAHDLIEILRTVAAGASPLVEARGPEGAAVWLAPGGATLRLDPATEEDRTGLFDDEDADPDEWWLDDELLYEEDDEDAWEDIESPWEPPESLAPGRTEGPGADPEAAVAAVGQSGFADACESARRGILERFDVWFRGRSRGIREARQAARRARAPVEAFLEFLCKEGVPASALHEYDLRLFLYGEVPRLLDDPRDPPRADLDVHYVLPALGTFFEFLDEEGIRCPWATDILDDEGAFMERWISHPDDLPDLALAAGNGRDDQDASREEWIVALVDWADELELDLAQRALLPGDETGDGTSWMESIVPEEWDLALELQRRWLLWRDEAVDSGLTDPDEVIQHARARQRAWETTPHPGVGGRTPLQAIADEEKAFERDYDDGESRE